jgi:hypothetical protein
MTWNSSGVGHAILALSLSGVAVDVHTTYIGDGLRSVVQSAIDLSRGSSSAIAFLPVEPGGTCMFFAGAKDEVYLQIVRFVDMQSPTRRWSGGRLVWAGLIGVREFVGQVLAMAERVLIDHGGVDSYAGSWGGTQFPIDVLQELRNLHG